jgi:hypothetical protein
VHHHPEVFTAQNPGGAALVVDHQELPRGRFAAANRPAAAPRCWPLRPANTEAGVLPDEKLLAEMEAYTEQ